ncbi:SDR family NAD(P)-dependent oxidoreductase [Isosphaeraceae bacterium EP7]
MPSRFIPRRVVGHPGRDVQKEGTLGDPADFDLIVLTPPGSPDPSLAIAGSRAGAIGVLNLEFADDPDAALAALARLGRHGRGRIGVLLDGADEILLAAVLGLAPPGLHALLLAGTPPGRLRRAIGLIHQAGRKAYIVVFGVDEAQAAEAAGADALVAKGHEAGGWVGEETTFVLLQSLLSRPTIPVWAHGGVGPRTAAACRAAGAAGAVLDSQLLLARESPLPEAVRARIGSMDGSETACLGSGLGAAFRSYSRPDLGPANDLRRLEAEALVAERPREAVRLAWREVVTRQVDWRRTSTSLLAIGQDATFAAGLASRYKTVGGIVDAIRRASAEFGAATEGSGPLAEGSPLARSHGTRYPIVQGPMTRVSDRAEFAAAVAESGALPFLALALMRAPGARTLLEATGRLLGNRPWGVGVLGFVPPELRAEQLEVLRAFRPPFALIAGGRPDQSRVLEGDGIATYLHVPSPGLLRMFLQEGASRFVFEGRECGGHVGPRTSFVLWESMIEVLLAHLDATPAADPTACHVLFAGGVHDGLSAAMAAAMAAPLVDRGVKIGVLMGTAYLFTDEAVRTGAIVDRFQKAAVACGRTVLLESGPGHATRCVPSPFVDDFAGEKRRLIREALPSDELRHRLEVLNIGRLRVASKGLDRDTSDRGAPGESKLVDVSDDDQWSRGMYMIGQIASLRAAVCSMDELHRDVSEGGARILGSAGANAVDLGPQSPPPCAVAIVGMACILPGSPDLKSYWSNILGKVDAITEVPADRWDWRQYYDADRSAPDKIYSRWGGFIDEVAFDPATYGIPPSSLASIEPFQLLALAVVRSALDDAGYLDRPFCRERTSVILGAGGGGADLTAGYMFRSSLPAFFGGDASAVTENLGSHLPGWTEDSFPGLLMNVAAGRVANRFDLGGVNYTVDAACASSLAAVYLAVRDLEARTSDVVVVGGIDAIQNPFSFLCFSKTQALSPTGRCRTFDAQGDGIAISEGFAAVILKRLDDAERDGDQIYGVIRGVGGSSDGRDRSLTAPRPDGQVRALRRAYAQAGIPPASVQLVEAHGTGTVAGDQAEVQALSAFFGKAGGSRQGCAVGSVKSMIGHTKATAGVAGLIKTALALHHKVLPPTLNVTCPNPRSNFPESPFYVNTEARPWIDPGGHPRRAGVSAFGFGGTNFHIAMEEYSGHYLDGNAAPVDVWPAELLVWRGDSRREILDSIKDLTGRLEKGARPALVDLAFTVARAANAAQAGPFSLAIVASSIDELIARLHLAERALGDGPDRSHPSRGVYFSGKPLSQEGMVAFLFPGQGSQYVDMARDVTLAFEAVRRCFDRADRVLAGQLDRPLSRLIFPPPVFTPEDELRLKAELTETSVAQPALGVTDIAYLSLLREFGVEPQMAAGHSFGEFVALHAAGCYGEEELLHLAAARGRFVKEETTEESGAMAAVDAPPEALMELLSDPGLTLANLNAPLQTVLSGSKSRIDAAVAWCEGREIRARLLPVSCAFHSPLVAPAQSRLAEFLREIPIAPPRIPVYSNTTAGVYPQDPGAIAGLLGEHLVRPVEFVREIEAMYEAGARIFVEVGPRNVLSGLVGRILGDRPHLCSPLDVPGRSGVPQLLHALASLVAEGVPVRLGRLFEGRTARALHLGSLDQETGRPKLTPTTWMVSGGKARPANPRAGTAEPPTLPLAIRVADGHQATPSPTRENPTIVGESSPRSDRNGDGTGNGHPSPGKSGSAGRNGHVAATPTPVPHPHQALSARNGGSMTPTTRPSPRISGEAIPQNRLAPYLASPPLAPTPGPAANGQGTTDIVRQFQQVMMRFLQTQETVMHEILTFLGTGAAALPTPNVDHRPAGAGADGNGFALDAPPAMEPVHAPQPQPQSHGGASAPAAPADIQATSPVVAVARVPVPPREEAPAPPPLVPGPKAYMPPSRAQLTQDLLAVVSERTGYPEEMLLLESDMEAELGIDSIKRVEIAGTILRALKLPAGQSPDVEKLTASRTLRQVVDTLVSIVGDVPGLATSASSGSPDPVGKGGETRPFEGARTGHGIGRFALNSTPSPAVGLAVGLAPDGLVVLVDDETGVGHALAARLKGAGYRVVRLVRDIDATQGSPQCLAGDLGHPEEVARLVEDLRANHGTPSGLIFLSALREEVSKDEDNLIALFLTSQALHADLERSAALGGAAVLAATRMGGAFATDRPGSTFEPIHGALGGYLKSLSQEWPTVQVKSVDVGREAPEVLANQFFGELMAADHLVEVGYLDGTRTVLELVPSPLPANPVERLPLDADSVLLITGGARGITYLAALKLAEVARPTLILVGRTPAPEGPESPETAGLTDPRALKSAIIAQLKRTHESVTPVMVEDHYRHLLNGRQIRENLERLRGTGARVELLTCDVRDPIAFGMLIDEVYRAHGRIDGVIHGAGVIEDRLVKYKSLDSFRRVVETKVNGARVLGEKLRPASLRFLAFFSSVSARFGNRGQADYAAASEVLNKLAQQLDRTWPARVVSINWGPWLQTGMVSAEVQRQFAERGVALIPPEVGCSMLLDELTSGRKGDVEILIGGDTSTAAGPVPKHPLLAVAGPFTRDADAVHLVRPLDLEIDHYLNHHCIDGQAVFPFAMAMELASEVAEAGWPGLKVVELRNIRLMKGIVVDGPGRAVRVTARPRNETNPSHADLHPEVTLEVSIAHPDDPMRVHYRMEVILAHEAGGPGQWGSPRLPGPLAPIEGVGQKSLSVGEAYRDLLFHGPLFQGIASIEAIGTNGARALFRQSSPADCLRGGPAQGWVIDPVLVDCAFQMQVLWARLHWDVTQLPAGVQSYRQFGPSGVEGRGTVRHELRVRPESQDPMCFCDHTFLDPEGRVFAVMTGVEGNGSRALNRLAGADRQRGLLTAANRPGERP